MEEFYKGSIINVRKLKTYNYILDIINTDDNIKKLDSMLNKLSKDKNKDIRKEVNQIIIDMFHPNPIKEVGKPIIYRKKTDVNGNIYGEELVTGIIFPIQNEYSKFDITYSKVNLKYLYLDKETGNVYTFSDSCLGNNYCLVNGVIKKELSMPLKEINNVFRIDVNAGKEIMIGSRKVKLTCVVPSSYHINMKPEMLFSNYKLVNYAITNESLADDIDIHYYLENFEKGFGKRKRRKEYSDMLQVMSLSNRLRDFVFIDDDYEKSLIKKI